MTQITTKQFLIKFKKVTNCNNACPACMDSIFKFNKKYFAEKLLSNDDNFDYVTEIVTTADLLFNEIIEVMKENDKL